VSTPGNPRYGKHLKRDELKEMLRPVPEATAGILGWLQASGIKQEDIEDDNEWINFVASVEQAERMMDTNFHVYESVVKPVQKVRTLQYSVPEDLAKYIDVIQPTTRFGQVRPQSNHIFESFVQGKVNHGSGRIKTAGALDIAAACNRTITPDCLKELYQITGYTPDADKAGFVGINGFLEQWAQYADLEDFVSTYTPDAAGANFSFTSVNGGLLDQNNRIADSVEANLDVQYVTPLVFPMNSTFYSTPGRGLLIPDLDQPSLDDNENEPYLEFFTFLTKQPDELLPHTVTTSYGEDEQSVPANYSRVVCNMIGQLGARGVSVIFSSGDTGVGSACQTNDGKNTTRFLPIFPAACPYVTAVGGTHFVEPEVAIGFSSGGFSDRWETPDYQKAALTKYLGVLGDQWDGLYNPEGRGFPDIAAQSSQFHVVDKGDEILVGGTSASAPLIASIIGLLNGDRIESGKKPLGFLNPWLYQTGYQGLTDIVDGGSTGCTGTDIYSGLDAPYVPYASWNATEGWDPVTGLGTPIFPKLLQLSRGNPSDNLTLPQYGGRFNRV